MEIYPAIDLKDGRCVRLVYGDFDSVHGVADDPVAVARSYRKAGASIIHVVDLDGAKDGVRKNAGLVRDIVREAAPAKVELGGGLRCMADLREADGLGVWRFIIGSAAVENPEFVREAATVYGKRVAVGIDSKDGLVRTHGWVRDSGLDETVFARAVFDAGVPTIISTDIAVDGTLTGPSVGRLDNVKKAVPDAFLVASGGVTTLDDVVSLRRRGISAAIVGKALYAGTLDLKEALFEARYGRLFDKMELVPAIIQHYDSKKVLMLGYMNRQSLALTLETGKATFWSRSRSEIWVKGMTSGNFLGVMRIDADCDEDTLLLGCRPVGPTCHTGNESCFFKEVKCFE